MTTGSNEIILLVEDEEDDVFFMQTALRKAGITEPLQVVRHGREAIAYLGGEGEYSDRRRYPFPTVMFLDLKMPYVTGFEVLEWLRGRKELSRIEVVVLTSSPAERDHTRAYQLGARSYLIKPPTPQMLVDIWQMLALRPHPNPLQT